MKEKDSIDITAEVWKDIAGYEGLYQVSNMGRVRSFSREVKCCGGHSRITRSHILHGYINGSGYYEVALCNSEGQSHRRVHELVAKAFIPNPTHLPVINHIDEDKANNKVNNLEWCTTAYNNAYGTRNFRIGETLKLTRTGRPVIQLSLDDCFLKEYRTIRLAARENHVQPSNIHKACDGTIKQTGGFKWRYKEEIKEAS